MSCLSGSSWSFLVFPGFSGISSAFLVFRCLCFSCPVLSPALREERRERKGKEDRPDQTWPEQRPTVAPYPLHFPPCSRCPISRSSRFAIFPPVVRHVRISKFRDFSQNGQTGCCKRGYIGPGMGVNVIIQTPLFADHSDPSGVM